MKALSLLVRKLWPRLKIFKSRSNFKVKVKHYSTLWKVLSQAKHMCNMKSLSLLVRKLWPRLKFFKSRLYFKVKVKNYGTMWKVLSQAIHMCNMKAPSLLVRKLWPRLKFFQKKVKLQGQGHEVKNYGPMWKVSSQAIHIHVQYERSISSGKKVMAKVKVLVHASNTDADANTRAMTLAPWTFVPAR